MDSILYFLPLAAVIALISSGTRREEFDDILVGALKIFVYLAIGTFAFSAILQFSLQIPALFYTLLVGLVSLLAYYTFKEVFGFSKPGERKPDAEAEAAVEKK